MTLPKTFKAAQVVKHGEKLVINDVELKAPEEGRIIVKVKASGLCRTDIHVAKGDHGPHPLPLTPGHEGCGEVVAIGPHVKDVKVGDRVGVPFLHSACAACTHCIEGWETVCANSTLTGWNKDGGMAEYVNAAGAYVNKLPDGLSYEQAAPITCAGVTVYKALKVSAVKPGQYVVITGAAGGLGHVACQYAKAMGMKVIAVTRKLDAEKEKMFKDYKVDFVVELAKEKIGEAVAKHTNGYGAHGVVCLAPSNTDITEAVQYVAKRGTIVPVGLDGGNFEASTVLTVVKAVSIVGSIVGTRQDLKEALQFAADGHVTCKVEKIPFAKVQDAFDKLEKTTIPGRMVITF